MKAKIPLKSIIFAAMVAALFSHCLLRADSTNSLYLTTPGSSWSLEIGAPGLKLEERELSPDGTAARLMAENKTAGIILSAFLEKAPHPGDAKQCREYYWAKAQKSPMKKDDIKMSVSGSVALVEYMVKQYQGVQVNQKNINAYLANKGYWMDVHISKGDFKPEDEAQLRAMIKDVHINEHFVPSARDCAAFGVFFYKEKRYARAIPYYEKALVLDKSSRQFSRTGWTDVLDELITAYGYTGKLEKAKALCESGIRKEPTYALFYYNLACAYAEMGDKKQAFENLRTAYRYKTNLPDHKKLPDAKTDSSFARYLSDPEFIKLVAENAK